MQNAWRAYLELALGLTEASKKKVQQVAKNLTSKGGTTAAQLQALAEEVASTSMANREALTKLVRFEVDRALGVVGLATAEEVADLTARVRDLERQLRDAQARAVVAEATEATAFAATGTPAPPPPPRPGGVAKKAAAKQTTAKTAVAKQAASTTAGAKKAVAKKAVATKIAAKRAAPAKGRAPVRREDQA
jgi:polyhydroxyalkanoate synthesis regulator phasin